MSKKIVVVGIGYVGLPLAIMLAKSGFKVVGVDINKKVVEDINNSCISIEEKDIEIIRRDKNVNQNLSAQEKPCDADVFVIAVPTPLKERGREADLSFVISALKSIIPVLRKGNLVIIESTIPPLTCRGVVKPLIEEVTDFKVGCDVFLAHCPERILPGNIFHELKFNNRIIGSIDETSSSMAYEIYSQFVEGKIDIVDDVTAETVKLMENTYRDVNVALANEFSLISETLGINTIEAIKLANKHPRVNILNPGIGVGGHCLPKDPWLLIQADPKHTDLISTARRINEMMPEKIASKIRKKVRNIIHPRILAMGLTYKPDSDDVRKSPALEILKLLEDEGYDIRGYDNFIPGFEYASIKEIAKNADCIVTLVEHTEIKEELDKCSDEIKSVMKNPIIFRLGNKPKVDIYDVRHSKKPKSKI